MQEKLVPETPTTERPNKKIKHRAPTTLEQEVPRFAFEPTHPTSPSAQGSSTDLPSSTFIGETPVRDASTTVVGSEPSNGPDPDISLENLSTSSTILPSRLKHLTTKYRFAQMTIKNGAKIESKVRTLIGFMSRFSYLDPSIKPGVVALRANAASVNKLISVVEIAKREITAMERGGKWWQYNELESEVKQVQRHQAKKSVKYKGGKQHLTGKGGRTVNGHTAVVTPDMGVKGKDLTVETDRIESEESDEEEAFETMAEPHDGSNASNTKLRNVPILTIYMSRVPVPEMRAEFSEQTNAPV